jgi:hypothetical protein
VCVCVVLVSLSLSRQVGLLRGRGRSDVHIRRAVGAAGERAGGGGERSHRHRAPPTQKPHRDHHGQRRAQVVEAVARIVGRMSLDLLPSHLLLLVFVW